MKNILAALTVIMTLTSCKVANKTSTTSNATLTATNKMTAEFDASTGLTIKAEGLEVLSIESFKMNKEISGVIPSTKFETADNNVEITIGAIASSVVPPTFDIKVTTQDSPCETVAPDNSYLSASGTGIYCSLSSKNNDTDATGSTSNPNTDSELNPGSVSVEEDLTSRVAFQLSDQSAYTGFPLPPRSNYGPFINEDAYCIQLYSLVRQEFPEGFADKSVPELCDID